MRVKIPNRIVKKLEENGKNGEMVKKSKYKKAASVVMYLFLLFVCGVEARLMGSWTGFEKSEHVVNLTFSIYLIATLVVGIPSNYIILKLGIRKSCFIASILFTVGAIFRCFFIKHPYFVYAGQFIAGMGAPLAQNGIYYYSKECFSNSKVVKM